MHVLPAGVRLDRTIAALLSGKRLLAYCCAIAIIYAALLLLFYLDGDWIVRRDGQPIYTEFTTAWVVASESVKGNLAGLYNSATFVDVQRLMVGAADYPNWPYPPTFSLFIAPFVLLSYTQAFLAWVVLPLTALAIVVMRITGRSAAISVLLASPFTAWNLMAGQSGFLTASLLGAALLTLEERPILSGLFIAGLTCKPQLGVLIPVALVAASRWRAFGSAVVFTLLLAAASGAAFGWAAWPAFPQGLFQQVGVVLEAGGASPSARDWLLLQTIYGLARALGGSAAAAWAVQGMFVIVLAALVWRTWRAPVRFDLQAATLSAVVLAATPYAFSYDLAGLAIPVAFIVRDQIRHGSFCSERMTMVAMGAISIVAVIVFNNRAGQMTFGSVPLGLPFEIALLLIVRARMALRCAGWFPAWPQTAALPQPCPNHPQFKNCSVNPLIYRGPDSAKRQNATRLQRLPGR